MNTEINPILLEESFDSWICQNLMYEPTTGGYIRNWNEAGSYYEVARSLKIKDSGKRGSERIYQALSEIERVKGIKL